MVAKYQYTEAVLRSVGDQWYWMESVISPTRTSMDKGNLAIVPHYMKEAELVAEQLGAWEDSETLYHEKSEICFKRDDNRQAFMSYKRSQAYRDDLINERKIQYIRNIHIKYERENRGQRMQTMKHDIEQERQIKRVFLLNGLRTILLCAAVIVFL